MNGETTWANETGQGADDRKDGSGSGLCSQHQDAEQRAAATQHLVVRTTPGPAPIGSAFETPRACLTCGAEFIPPRNKHYTIAEHCSMACYRKIAWRQREAAPRPIKTISKMTAIARVKPAPPKWKPPRVERPKKRGPKVGSGPGWTPVERPALTPTGKQRWSDESRWRFGARKIGVTFEAYAAQVQAGNKWCSYHQRWEPVGLFGPHKRWGLDTRCIEASREAAREWQRAHRKEQAS